MNPFYKLLKYSYRFNVSDNPSLKQQYKNKIDLYKNMIGGADDEKLNNKIIELQTGINDFIKSFSEYQTKVKEECVKPEINNEEIGQLKSKIEELTKTIKAKDEEINKLTSELIEIRSKLETNDTEKDNKIEEQAGTIKEQTAKIENLEKQLETIGKESPEVIELRKKIDDIKKIVSE